MNAPLVIKDFGRDRGFNSVQELENALASDYRGKHVSIVYTTKGTGMKKVVFVSVNEVGVVCETHGKGCLIDFPQLQSSALV